MFIIYFHYMLYQAGDENYDLAALTSASLSEYPMGDIGSVLCYPNPMDDNGAIISLNEPIDIKSMIYIYDVQGNLIKRLNHSNIHNDTSVFWDGTNDNGTQVRAGLYYVSAKANNKINTVSKPMNIGNISAFVELISKIIAELYPLNPNFTIYDVLSLMEKNPQWVFINQHVRQKDVKE